MCARIVWDQTGSRLYQTGVDRVVLYPHNDDGSSGAGVGWNGVTAIDESPEGGEPNPIYANNKKYLEMISPEEFGLGLTAYTYPDEWEECDGSRSIVPGVTIRQQNRRSFDLTYRTLVGNDIIGTDYGYILHLVWNGKASPSERSYATVNDSPEAMELSWDITTTKTELAGYQSTACLNIETAKLDEAGKAALAQLEDLLYGTENAEPRMVTLAEAIQILSGSSEPEEGSDPAVNPDPAEGGEG